MMRKDFDELVEEIRRNIKNTYLNAIDEKERKLQKLVEEQYEAIINDAVEHPTMFDYKKSIGYNRDKIERTYVDFPVRIAIYVNLPDDFKEKVSANLQPIAKDIALMKEEYSKLLKKLDGWRLKVVTTDAYKRDLRIPREFKPFVPEELSELIEE